MIPLNTGFSSLPSFEFLNPRYQFNLILNVSNSGNLIKSLGSEGSAIADTYFFRTRILTDQIKEGNFDLLGIQVEVFCKCADVKKYRRQTETDHTERQPESENESSLGYQRWKITVNLPCRVKARKFDTKLR